jgi:hypothetical protein
MFGRKTRRIRQLETEYLAAVERDRERHEEAVGRFNLRRYELEGELRAARWANDTLARGFVRLFQEAERLRSLVKLIHGATYPVAPGTDRDAEARLGMIHRCVAPHVEGIGPHDRPWQREWPEKPLFGAKVPVVTREELPEDPDPEWGPAEPDTTERDCAVKSHRGEPVT